jgi:hypothetical protein
LYCCLSFFLFLMNAIGARDDGALWSLCLLLGAPPPAPPLSAVFEVDHSVAPVCGS